MKPFRAINNECYKQARLFAPDKCYILEQGLILPISALQIGVQSSTQILDCYRISRTVLYSNIRLGQNNSILTNTLAQHTKCKLLQIQITMLPIAPTGLTRKLFVSTNQSSLVKNLSKRLRDHQQQKYALLKNITLGCKDGVFQNPPAQLYVSICHYQMYPTQCNIRVKD